MNVHCKSVTPLVNSHVDNVPVQLTSDLNQPLFQFINDLDVYMLNTFLSGRPYLVVNWLEAWVVWRSKIERNKVWLFYTAV